MLLSMDIVLCNIMCKYLNEVRFVWFCLKKYEVILWHIVSVSLSYDERQCEAVAHYIGLEVNVVY